MNTNRQKLKIHLEVLKLAVFLSEIPHLNNEDYDLLNYILKHSACKPCTEYEDPEVESDHTEISSQEIPLPKQYPFEYPL
jgi:hypothetical protein